RAKPMKPAVRWPWKTIPPCPCHEHPISKVNRDSQYLTSNLDLKKDAPTSAAIASRRRVDILIRTPAWIGICPGITECRSLRCWAARLAHARRPRMPWRRGDEE